MAESVDALVSNTSGATRAGSTPALGTRLKQQKVLQLLVAAPFFFVGTLVFADENQMKQTSSHALCMCGFRSTRELLQTHEMRFLHYVSSEPYTLQRGSLNAFVISSIWAWLMPSGSKPIALALM